MQHNYYHRDCGNKMCYIYNKKLNEKLITNARFCCNTTIVQISKKKITNV